MKKTIGVIMMCVALLVQCSDKETGDVKENTVKQNIGDEAKWDLTDIYESDEAWNLAKENLIKKFSEIDKYKGQLAKSPKILFECLKLQSEIGKTFGRLYSYAGMNSDLDTRVSKYQAMKQEIGQIGTEFNSMASFVDPEILKMSIEKIDEFISVENGLKDFRFYLHDLFRSKEHLLSAKEERIIAEAGLMSGAASSIYGIFSNADFPYPTVKLTDGSDVYLDAAGFSKYRATSNREDRKKVFGTFFGELNKYSRTYGAQLSANVKKDLFYKRVRNYESCLESSLDGNNIPVEVYHKLIDNVHSNIGTFHRYLKLKANMMNIDTLSYYDIYAPAVGNFEKNFTYEEGSKMVLDAVEPLGDDYKNVVQKAFDKRWIDIYPAKGKRSGAYSNGSVYDEHPYILLNYNGSYNDVSTLIHELGHTMHSYYSNKTQPYETADYSIFVAENEFK